MNKRKFMALSVAASMLLGALSMIGPGIVRAEETALQNGYYQSYIELKNINEPSKDSMAKNAFPNTALITVKDSGAEISLLPQPVDLLGKHGHVLKLYAYESKEAYEKGEKPVELPAVDTYVEDGQMYPARFVVKSTERAPKEIVLRFNVDAMNALGGSDNEKDALLKLDKPEALSEDVVKLAQKMEEMIPDTDELNESNFSTVQELKKLCDANRDSVVFVAKSSQMKALFDQLATYEWDQAVTEDLRNNSHSLKDAKPLADLYEKYINFSDKQKQALKKSELFKKIVREYVEQELQDLNKLTPFNNEAKQILEFAHGWANNILNEAWKKDSKEFFGIVNFMTRFKAAWDKLDMGSTIYTVQEPDPSDVEIDLNEIRIYQEGYSEEDPSENYISMADSAIDRQGKLIKRGDRYFVRTSFGPQTAMMQPTYVMNVVSVDLDAYEPDGKEIKLLKKYAMPPEQIERLIAFVVESFDIQGMAGDIDEAAFQKSLIPFKQEHVHTFEYEIDKNHFGKGLQFAVAAMQDIMPEADAAIVIDADAWARMEAAEQKAAEDAKIEQAARAKALDDLKAAIAEAKAAKTAGMTAESIRALNDQIKAAEAMLMDTKSTSQEINAMVTAVREAAKNLKPITPQPEPTGKPTEPTTKPMESTTKPSVKTNAPTVAPVPTVKPSESSKKTPAPAVTSTTTTSGKAKVPATGEHGTMLPAALLLLSATAVLVYKRSRKEDRA